MRIRSGSGALVSGQMDGAVSSRLLYIILIEDGMDPVAPDPVPACRILRGGVGSGSRHRPAPCSNVASHFAYTPSWALPSTLRTRWRSFLPKSQESPLPPGKHGTWEAQHESIPQEANAKCCADTRAARRTFERGTLGGCDQRSPFAFERRDGGE